MRTVAITDFLTEAQIIAAIAVMHRGARAICDDIIAPHIAEINQRLGQENDPMYLAYAVEYALRMATNQQEQLHV